jgi:hypothetical protein
MPENGTESDAAEQEYVDRTRKVGKAQQRWEAHLADRYPHLPTPDFIGTERIGETSDPEALQAAAEAVARGEADPLDYSVAALARKLIYDVEKWEAAKQWIAEASNVREVLEEGDSDGA